MCLRLPSISSRYEELRVIPNHALERLVGVENNRFRISRAKECPAKLCELIATSVIDSLTSVFDDATAQAMDSSIASNLRDMLVPFDPYLEQEIGHDHMLF